MDVYDYMGAAEREERTPEEMRDKISAQDALIKELVEALEMAIKMLDELKHESGRGVEWGEEDSFRMGEWFDQEELAAMENMGETITKAKAAQ